MTRYIYLSLLLLSSLARSAEVQHLADLNDRLVIVRQGWGEIGMDTCAYGAGQKPLPLRVGDKTFARGIGAHAPGEIVVYLDGQFERFESSVGLQPLPGKDGSVVFQVFVDDQKEFDSGLMRADTPAKHISVSVKGAEELRLVVTDARDGLSCDCANWAEARLTPIPGARASEPPRFDVAPFAMLTTSDPARVDGARASRVQEYRREDVYLERPFILRDGQLPPAIGLSWLERRPIRESELIFRSAPTPPPDGTQVQAWIGPTAWQGQWTTLAGTLGLRDNTWRFAADHKGNAGLHAGTRKIRWLIPERTPGLRLERITALVAERTAIQQLLVETEPASPLIRVSAYNGNLAADSAGAVNPGQSSRLSIQYVRRPRAPGDRTLLRISMPGHTGLSVAVDDVLANPAVYIRDPGVLVTRADSKLTLAQYKQQIAGRKTILEEVRAAPDQTLAAAMRQLHHFQEGSPVMLSLACDNNKFVVARDGSCEFPLELDRPDTGKDGSRDNVARMGVKLGDGNAKILSRRLEGGWLPVPVTEFTDDHVAYRQRAMVVPVGEVASDGYLARSLCISEFTATNKTDRPRAFSMAFDFAPGDLLPGHGGAVVKAAGRILAKINTDLPLTGSSVNGTLAPGQTARVTLLLPAWKARVEELAETDPDPLARVHTYWQRLLAQAMQVDLPDELLTNVIRASQVHCLIAARSEDAGRRIAPWIASMSYGPLESEANSIIRGMGLFGHDRFAQRSLDYFIARYDPAGFLTTGYTLMGTGWHLQTLAEHYQLTRDRAWLAGTASKIESVCNWIARQREKTRMPEGDAVHLPEEGLAPPGVMADWSNYAYYFCLNGYYCAGLRDAAQALGDIGFSGAPELGKAGDEYAAAIRRAFAAAQALAPVVPLRDGTWVRFYPTQVHAPGPSADFFPGEDGNRSWCYDVELGAHHLVSQGILDPHAPEVTQMLDQLEDVQFLADGWFDFPAAESQNDPYTFGGFAKVQPYYCRNVEIYALRDDLKPFIRSYFNTLPTLLNTEVLSLQEHFHGVGAWNKTHETGYFLQQTRFMLVMERGDTLWLAPFITSNWLKDGMTVGVRDAPTRFGKVSYRISSALKDGHIDATIEPPTRSPPRQIALRLRHPDEQRITRVTIDGKPSKEFDAEAGVIRIAPSARPISVRAFFGPRD